MHRCEGVAVHDCWTQVTQRRKMLRRAVADVVLPVIAWHEARQPSHLGIAKDLGENRGRGDTHIACIGPGLGAARKRETRNGDGIAHDEPRLRIEAPDGLAHGTTCGLEDIVSVDLRGAPFRHCPANAGSTDGLGEHLATTARQLLGIIHAGENNGGAQNDRRHGHGAGQGTPANLVNPGDQAELLLELSIE